MVTASSTTRTTFPHSLVQHTLAQYRLDCTLIQHSFPLLPSEVLYSVVQGSVAELAERQPSLGVTWVRSLPAAPSRCGSGPSGPEPSGWLINQLGNPSLHSFLGCISWRTAIAGLRPSSHLCNSDRAFRRSNCLVCPRVMLEQHGRLDSPVGAAPA
jgi:hypothetical protein